MEQRLNIVEYGANLFEQMIENKGVGVWEKHYSQEPSCAHLTGNEYYEAMKAKLDRVFKKCMNETANV